MVDGAGFETCLFITIYCCMFVRCLKIWSGTMYLEVSQNFSISDRVSRSKAKPVALWKDSKMPAHVMQLSNEMAFAEEPIRAGDSLER